MILTTEVEIILGNNTKYYEDLGYVIPRRIDSKGRLSIKKKTKILVKLKDIPLRSHAMIRIKCDYCGEIVERMYDSINTQKKKSKSNKYCCNICCETQKLSMFEKYGVRHASQVPEFLEKIIIGETTPFNIIEKEFKDRGYTLMSTSYDSTERLKYICNVHKEKGILEITYSHFKNGEGCKQCGYDRTSGENNYAWNFDKTTEEREDKRQTSEYRDWRKKVYENDNYTCQCCGERGGKLNAHHLYNYSSNKELRIEATNGVTVCKECHVEFHSKYGVKNNTPEQFEEFKSSKQLNNNKVI